MKVLEYDYNTGKLQIGGKEILSGPRRGYVVHTKDHGKVHVIRYVKEKKAKIFIKNEPQLSKI